MRKISEILNNPAYTKKVLVTVFPHPDDESLPVGGLVHEAAAQGWKVVVLSLTQGEAGLNYVSRDRRPLAEVRREELRRASARLGAAEVILGSFEDGQLQYTRPSWCKWLREHLDRLDPDVVLTYDPSGFYGHPDHIAVTREVLDLYRTTDRFDLLFMSVPGYIRKLARGKLGAWLEKARPFMVEPTHRLQLGRGWWHKWLAVREHKSQSLGKDLPLPLSLYLLLFNYELYHLADKKSRYVSEFVGYPIEGMASSFTRKS